jgi:hypothetical protein
MDMADITTYEEIYPNARVEFKDNSSLVLVPFRKYGPCEGMDSVLLYQGGTLEALAQERISHYWKQEDTGFWSKGKITQQQLADYWNTTAKLGKKFYDDYGAKKISEDDWRNKFWELWIISMEGWVTRDSLQKGILRVFDKNPGRYRERI